MLYRVRRAGLQKLERVLADRGTEQLDSVLVLDDHLVRAVFAEEHTIVIPCRRMLRTVCVRDVFNADQAHTSCGNQESARKFELKSNKLVFFFDPGSDECLHCADAHSADSHTPESTSEDWAGAGCEETQITGH